MSIFVVLFKWVNPLRGIKSILNHPIYEWMILLWVLWFTVVACKQQAVTLWGFNATAAMFHCQLNHKIIDHVYWINEIYEGQWCLESRSVLDVCVAASTALIWTGRWFVAEEILSDLFDGRTLSLLRTPLDGGLNASYLNVKFSLIEKLHLN